MRVTRVKAFAPATVANVGPGFDVFGFAIEGIGDVVEATRSAQVGVRLLGIEGDGGKLPRDPGKNVATAVARKMLRVAAPGFGIEVRLKKGLPLGSGLGSSSASAVAAAVAVNALLGDAFSPEELLEFARFGEKVACGSAHADNVAPALLGGFTIVRGGDPPDVIGMPVPRSWHVAVVHPHFELPTRKARAAVPSRVPLRKMTGNVANAAAMVAALAKKDLALFGVAVMSEAVVTPARVRLIPGFADVGRAALHAGAKGFSISGAGPSLFALTESRRGATIVGAKMARAWQGLGVAADVFVSRVGTQGARIVERS